MVENGSLCRARGVAVVMRRDGVQQLSANRGIEPVGTLLDHPQAEVDMAEQPALLGGPERRSAPELAHPPHVVQKRGREDEVGAEPLVQL